MEEESLIGVKMSGHGRKKVYGEERAVRWEVLGMVEEGDFGEREMGDGELVEWEFLI